MAEKAFALAAFGARGTGKTAFVTQHLAKINAQRVATWDFKNDPALRGMGVAYTSLDAFVLAMRAPTFNIRYLVNHTADIQKQFKRFCEGCWTASRLVMFVDELPEVTKANSAPPTWRRCVNVGRSYESPMDGKPAWLSIIGAGQRAAECDKSFTSNADIVHCGRLVHEDDAKAMGKVLGVPAQELMTLPNLHWIERGAGDMAASRGILSFSGKKTQKKLPPAPVKKAAYRASA